MPEPKPQVEVAAERHLEVARLQWVRFTFPGAVDARIRAADHLRLDLCLSPRPPNARARWLEPGIAREFAPLGEVFLLPPGPLLHTRSDGGCRQDSLICELPAGRLAAWLDTSWNWEEEALLAGGLDLRHGGIRRLLRLLARELRRPGFAADLMLELLVGQLALELVRLVRASRPPGRAVLGSRRWARIEERLQAEGPPPSLAELSRLAGLSVRQFTRAFRARYGCSVGSYAARLRLERAQALLAAGQPVKAVALTLGFASTSSFCSAFRRATGESPGAFQARRLGSARSPLPGGDHGP
ncbi:MAG: hypothetical protein KatS3mg124_0176 [Porticoccaceae bacterium]|nr:MAG: hypothetical protein KatS3mg124_0176 [Porticoccaceae bacterium]